MALDTARQPRCRFRESNPPHKRRGRAHRSTFGPRTQKPRFQSETTVRREMHAPRPAPRTRSVATAASDDQATTDDHYRLVVRYSFTDPLPAHTGTTERLFQNQPMFGICSDYAQAANHSLFRRHRFATLEMLWTSGWPWIRSTGGPLPRKGPPVCHHDLPQLPLATPTYPPPHAPPRDRPKRGVVKVATSRKRACSRW